MKTNKKTFIKPLVIILAMLSILFTLSNQKIQAVSGSDWSAGNIVNDSLFYNSSAMSVEDVQYFLNSKIGNCDTQGTQPASDLGYPGLTHAQYAAMQGWAGPPYICLKDYYQVPDSSQIISNYQGSIPSGAISAAAIIKNAADNYGISPKVLLVTLQKESLNLIHDTWPLLSQYKNSMGYACPDTAPCDAQYAGFYNQMQNAARQFSLYRQNTNSYRYKPFQDNSIYYNPNYSCGASAVNVQSYATAGLYNYTPYQPNQAALNNLYGTGDSCSAYGNRNFWRIYNDWFGSTQYEEEFLSYKSHISYLGWTGSNTNHGITGTTGQSKSMEAFKINGEVEYSSYSINTGWQPTVNRGMISGTTGQNKAIQAIKINPIGTLASKYDIYYRVHVSNVGWMGWAKNGEIAGVTGGSSNNIEAFEIILTPIGSSAPGSIDNKYQNKGTTTNSSTLTASVTSHVGNVGWQPTVTDGMVSGTTEQNKRIEALTLSLNNTTGKSGSIIYSSHLAGIGWQEFKKDGELSGTTNQSRQVEAVRIALSGELGDDYDVWYRGYVKYIGWLDWAKNGNAVGSIGAGRQLEAIEVRITPINSLLLNQTRSLYNPSSLAIPESYLLNYTSHVSFIGWLNPVQQNNISGTIGKSKSVEAIKINNLSSIYGDISINCSGYVKNTGWSAGVSTGNICGTTGQTKPLEAIKLSLSGAAAGKYDIYYKTHLSWLGWQNWVKNNEASGIIQSSYNIEAVDIKLQTK